MQVVNKKARLEYEIVETYEAGLKLAGHEVKSLRAGKAHLQGSFVRVSDDGQAWLHNMHIHPYSFARLENYEPTQTRKLLLKKNQILKLQQYNQRKGVALVPLKVYTKGSLFKVEVGVGRGKKQHERRADIKKRDQERDLQSDFKQSQLR